MVKIQTWKNVDHKSIGEHVEYSTVDFNKPGKLRVIHLLPRTKHHSAEHIRDSQKNVFGNVPEVVHSWIPFLARANRIRC